MTGVLEKVKYEEHVSSKNEESYLASEETGREEVLREPEMATQQRKFELAEDSLSIYFGEVGQFSLLNAKETKMLGSQMEDGKHLTRLEEDWITEHGSQPSVIDLLLALTERLSRARPLFEALWQYLRLPSQSSITEKAFHPELRRVIDNKVEEELCSAIADVIGGSSAKVEREIIELSLDSRLIPWHIIKGAGRKESFDEFRKMVQSPMFRGKLEAHRPEIVKHFNQIRERAQQATDRMIQANLRLVISVAKNHIGWGVPLPDLIQEGNIGLMQAVRKFDHRRGNQFSTYAVLWIWQAITRAVSENSRTIRLPGHIIDNLTKLARARTNLTQKLGRQPTDKELAAETGLPSQKIQSLLMITASGPVSLETPIGEDGTQLGDFIADQESLQPEAQATASLLREELSKTLESLTPRERRVIELRFGLGNEPSRTLEEIGIELGLSKERIRQIEKEALAKLRHPSHSRELIEFLG
jgi:RNA polymerase primary sigma factor